MSDGLSKLGKRKITLLSGVAHFARYVFIAAGLGLAVLSVFPLIYVTPSLPVMAGLAIGLILMKRVVDATFIKPWYQAGVKVGNSTGGLF